MRQQLSADGTKLSGDPVPLIKDDQKWEWKLVEAPQMVKAPNNYQLFYSAAFFGWGPNERLSNYATGYANCSGPLGPCTRAATSAAAREIPASATTVRKVRLTPTSRDRPTPYPRR